MPVPKKRTSRGRHRARRSHLGLSPIGLIACQTCRSPKLPHRVCPVCGFYDGRTVIAVAEQRGRS